MNDETLQRSTAISPAIRSTPVPAHEQELVAVVVHEGASLHPDKTAGPKARCRCHRRPQSFCGCQHSCGHGCVVKTCFTVGIEVSLSTAIQAVSASHSRCKQIYLCFTRVGQHARGPIRGTTSHDMEKVGFQEGVKPHAGVSKLTCRAHVGHRAGWRAGI